MKRLVKHTISLLRLYDSVVLPDIGIVRIQYVAAEINRARSLLFPPHFEIIFERQSGIKDRRLLDSYVRKEQITVEEARKELQEDLAALAEGQPGSLVSFLEELRAINPPLPELELKEVFAPANEDAGRLLEMHDIQEPVEAELGELPISEDTVPEMDSPEVIERESECPEKHHDGNWRNPDYYYIPVHKKVAKIAACFLLVAAVGLSVVISLYRRDGNATSTASIVPLTVSEEVTGTLVSGNPDTEGDSTLSEQKPAVEDEADNDSIPGALSLPSTPFVQSDEDGADEYYAVVGAFKTLKESEKFIDSHKGDKSRFKIIKNSKYYLISASSSSDRADLESNMPLIRSDYPDAWIFTLN